MLGPGLGVGRRAPAEARATPRSSALAPPQGQVSGCGATGAGRGEAGGERSRAGRERTPLPRRSCPLAGGGHPACTGKRGGGLFLERRTREAGRGRERERVCRARAGAGASPDPNPSSPPPRGSSRDHPAPCGPHSEAKGLSPRALVSPFVAGAGKPERGTREAAARRGALARRWRGARPGPASRGPRGCEELSRGAWAAGSVARRRRKEDGEGSVGES